MKTENPNRNEDLELLLVLRGSKEILKTNSNNT